MNARRRNVVALALLAGVVSCFGGGGDGDDESETSSGNANPVVPPEEGKQACIEISILASVLSNESLLRRIHPPTIGVAQCYDLSVAAPQKDRQISGDRLPTQPDDANCDSVGRCNLTVLPESRGRQDCRHSQGNSRRGSAPLQETTSRHRLLSSHHC